MTKLLSALLPIALLLQGCSKAPEPKADPPAAAVRAGQVVLPAGSPKLKQIRVETVATAVVPMDVVDAPGKIEVNPNRVSHVVTPLAGRIVGVSARLGDTVEQGQPLVTIESADADAAMSAYLQSESVLGQMKAAQLKAQADLDRIRDLLEHDAVAKKEVLNAENNLVQARATVDQGEASRQQALRRIQILGLKPGEFGQKIVLRAPVSGKVLEMNIVPGEFRNDTNAPLMTIADLSTVWVTADVPETAIRKIDPGEQLEIELSAYPGEKFRTRVARISDTVDPTTRTIKVRAELDNRRGRLRPEMFGRVRHTESSENLPVIPPGALVQNEGQSFVWRETAPGTFEQTPVKTGNRAGDMLAVLSGLKAGDRVVTDGVMLLKN